MARPAAQTKEAYLSAHRAFERGLNGADRFPLRSLRRQAADRFERLDFPTTGDEAWRYTNAAPIVATRFQPALRGRPVAVGPEQIEPFAYDAIQLVFVNGRYAPELSSLEHLPDGARAGSLSADLDPEDTLLSKHLGQIRRL